MSAHHQCNREAFAWAPDRDASDVLALARVRRRLGLPRYAAFIVECPGDGTRVTAVHPAACICPNCGRTLVTACTAPLA